MNDNQLQLLASELASDPLGLGFKRGGEWLPDQACAELLNAENGTAFRSSVTPAEVKGCLALGDWRALDPESKTFFTLQMEREKLDFSAGSLRADLGLLFPPGTATGDAIVALVTRADSRAEAVLGERNKVDAAQIERAKRVSEGLHPDHRDESEPIMAKLFAEKRAKEAADAALVVAAVQAELAAAKPEERVAKQAELAAAQAIRAEKERVRDEHPVKAVEATAEVAKAKVANGKH